MRHVAPELFTWRRHKRKCQSIFHSCFVIIRRNNITRTNKHKYTPAAYTHTRAPWATTFIFAFRRTGNMNFELKIRHSVSRSSPLVRQRFWYSAYISWLSSAARCTESDWNIWHSIRMFWHIFQSSTIIHSKCFAHFQAGETHSVFSTRQKRINFHFERDKNVHKRNDDLRINIPRHTTCTRTTHNNLVKRLRRT